MVLTYSEMNRLFKFEYLSVFFSHSKIILHFRHFFDFMTLLEA